MKENFATGRSEIKSRGRVFPRLALAIALGSNFTLHEGAYAEPGRTSKTETAPHTPKAERTPAQMATRLFEAIENRDALVGMPRVTDDGINGEKILRGIIMQLKLENGKVEQVRYSLKRYKDLKGQWHLAIEVCDKFALEYGVLPIGDCSVDAREYRFYDDWGEKGPTGTLMAGESRTVDSINRRVVGVYDATSGTGDKKFPEQYLKVLQVLDGVLDNPPPAPPSPVETRLPDDIS